MTKTSSQRFLQGLSVLVLSASAGVVRAQTVDYFTDNGYGNPISTLQHPCAEHDNGITYIAYQGPHEDPYVCAYDHASGQWAGPVKAGVNPMGKTPDTVDKDEIDNHGRPAMLVDAKGYIHLVFGGHGGHSSLGRNLLGTPGQGRQTHVVSKRPRDISAWDVVDNISPFGTYSQFVKMQDGDIYLFYRHGSHRSDWVYQKSTDGGRSFDAPVSVLKHKVQERNPNVHDAWYAWFDNGMGDTITASYVYHPCAVRGHTKERYNCYYMTMNCADDSWQNSPEHRLDLPITKEYADQHTLVLNTGSERSNHGTCHVDDEGHPHLFFRQGTGQVRYYRWLGDRWQDSVTVTNASRSQDGDFAIESPHVIRMLLNAGESGGGEVSWWKTTDGGLSWAWESRLIRHPNAGYDVSAMVRNAHPDARIVAAEKNGSQNHQYRKLFLLGDHGALGRPADEAQHLGDRLTNLEVSKAAAPSGKIKQRRNTPGADRDD